MVRRTTVTPEPAPIERPAIVPGDAVPVVDPMLGPAVPPEPLGELLAAPPDAIALAAVQFSTPALPWFLEGLQGDRSAILAAAVATPGIARRMDHPASPPELDPSIAAAVAAGELTDQAADFPTAQAQGGGNLNGSANEANMLGQAGTDGQRIAVPRLPSTAGAGNFCGVV